MKELVVVSGKGGTGKTSIVAAFAALADRKVMADCDVDAANLHLVLKPEVKHREAFSSGHEAVIHAKDCTACGACQKVCRYEAIQQNEAVFEVDPFSCEGCGVCVHVCPSQAIDFPTRQSGEWFISETRHGPMVHARLGIAEENSGKLVTVVRKQASRVALEAGLDMAIIDGPPGIGCPVIASIGGTSLVLIVTEPTVSGLHDMERVAELAAHFRVPMMLCINKCDINPEMAEALRKRAAELKMWVAGEIPYDTTMTQAQIAGQSIIEFDGEGAAAKQIRRIWKTAANVMERMSNG